jgi:hypothetical protein
MKDTRKVIRQGDVMLVPIDNLPENLQPAAPENDRLIIAHGEVTGHHHSFAMSDRIAMFREDGSGGGLFLFAQGPVALEHQEHDTIPVPPGAWEVRRQRTATSAGVSMRVAD